MEAVLEDYRTAPLEERERALFALLAKVNAASNQIRREDLEEARAAGWSDEALYDALTVCALFNFYNVWVDATGVPDLPSEAYAHSGQRLATRGYVVEPRANGGYPVGSPPGDAPSD